MEVLGGKLDRWSVLMRWKDHGRAVGEAVEEKWTHVGGGIVFW